MPYKIWENVGCNRYDYLLLRGLKPPRNTANDFQSFAGFCFVFFEIGSVLLLLRQILKPVVHHQQIYDNVS